MIYHVKELGLQVGRQGMQMRRDMWPQLSGTNALGVIWHQTDQFGPVPSSSFATRHIFSLKPSPPVFAGARLSFDPITNL